MAVSTIANQNPCFARTSWGTSLTFTLPNGHPHALIQYGANGLFSVWFPSTSDIATMWISSSGGPYYKSGSGSITFSLSNPAGSDLSITRNGSTITFTSSSNATITAKY